MLLSSCNASVSLYKNNYENKVAKPVLSALPDYYIFLYMFLFPSVVMYMYFVFMYLFNFYFLWRITPFLSPKVC